MIQERYARKVEPEDDQYIHKPQRKRSNEKDNTAEENAGQNR
jgi:hypothetical protein